MHQQPFSPTEPFPYVMSINFRLSFSMFRLPVQEKTLQILISSLHRLNQVNHSHIQMQFLLFSHLFHESSLPLQSIFLSSFQFYYNSSEVLFPYKGCTEFIGFIKSLIFYHIFCDIIIKNRTGAEKNENIQL